ncbi:DNA cytosine methyltransferase [Atlantibacter hermannii]|uniref:DNA cytosine methyltransferase n=1 Tax=Atlantibacter hermannii TaxID=565 RepID=UPI002FDA9FA9
MIGIDLFAGAGGMSLGARRAGIDVQLVVEADKYAAETYLKNHVPLYPLFNGDIRNFEKININNQEKQELVLFGGPPCQGFSTSNRKTRNSTNKDNWLFVEFMRVVKMYMPDWVVFENVRGILDTEGGVFAKKVSKQLKKLGYHCEDALLNSEDYGVPQKRYRYFIVASLNNNKFNFPPKYSLEKVTVGEALFDLPEVGNGNNVCYLPYSTECKSKYASEMRGNETGCHNNLVTKNSDIIIERYKYIPEGGNWEDIPEYLMANYKDRSRCHTGIYHRLMANSVSVVIGNFRKNMLIHPLKDRGLSVREAARLQSFPDDFIFAGSIGFQQQQVGNAVPPLLAEAIFKQIISAD